MANINDMTVGSPARGIFRFAVPLILGYILQQMYLLVDAALVGRWLGVGALAAVGASTGVIFLIMGFCNGSCAGFAIPVAQAFGAKDYVKMRTYVSNAVRIVAVMAAVITLLSCMFCERIMHIINTPADIFHEAYLFLFIQFLAIPFTLAYNLFADFIRSLGNSKQPFYFLIVASVSNILLALLMLIVLGLGVEGVALATLLSQALSATLCIRYIRKRMPMLVPQGRERRYDNKRISILLNNGVPMGLQFSITGIGIIMLQSANNSLGTVYVASFTAAMRIKYLFTCVFENIGVAMATYCGQNIGAHRLDRVRQGLWAALKMMAVYAAFSFAVIYPFADYLMRLFVNGHEQAVIANAALLMRVACYFYLSLGVLTIFRYSIQGLGFSNLAMMSGVMEMIARSGVSLWLVPTFGYLGVCYGDPVAWMSADLFLIPALLWAYRHLRHSLATTDSKK